MARSYSAGEGSAASREYSGVTNSIMAMDAAAFNMKAGKATDALRPIYDLLRSNVVNEIRNVKGPDGMNYTRAEVAYEKLDEVLDKIDEIREQVNYGNLAIAGKTEEAYLAALKTVEQNARQAIADLEKHAHERGLSLESDGVRANRVTQSGKSVDMIDGKYLEVDSVDGRTMKLTEDEMKMFQDLKPRDGMYSRSDFNKMADRLSAKSIGPIITQSSDYVYHSHPDHGYLEVPERDIVRSGFTPNPQFSTKRGGKWFLEEDDEMPKFLTRVGWMSRTNKEKLNNYEKRGILKIKEVSHDTSFDENQYRNNDPGY